MALRRFLTLFRLGARARGAMAAAAGRGEKARACAKARVRAIGARVEESAASAVACAEARAQAARPYLLRAMIQADEAATLAAVQFRQGSDMVVGKVLRILYGEMAPVTPTPSEILKTLVQWGITARKLHNLHDKFEKAVEAFEKAVEAFESMSPVEAGMILSSIVMPLGAFYFCRDITYAPECMCPFAGLRSIEVYDCTVEEALFAVLSLAAKCGGLVALVVGGLCMSICTDLGLFAVGIDDSGSWIGDTDELVCGSTITWSCSGETAVVKHLEWGPAF